MTEIEPSIRYAISEKRAKDYGIDESKDNLGLLKSQVRLSKRDKNVFDISKTRAKWDCIVCEKEIDEGSVVIGSGYIKVCLGCANKFLTDIENSFNQRAKEVADVKTQINQNKEKFEKTNMLAKIKKGSKGK